MNKIQLLPQHKWFLSLQLQFIPCANFEGKICCPYSVLNIVPMYNDIHFSRSALLCTKCRSGHWGSALVESSSAGMRQTLQAHGVMRDSSSSPSCHNKLIPASLTSHSRQSSELGASAQGRSCRATVRARRTVTPVLMEGLLGDEDDDASGRDVSPALKLLVLCGGSESAPPAGRHACILRARAHSCQLARHACVIWGIQRMNYDSGVWTQMRMHVCFGPKSHLSCISLFFVCIFFCCIFPHKGIFPSGIWGIHYGS